MIMYEYDVFKWHHWARWLEGHQKLTVALSHCLGHFEYSFLVLTVQFLVKSGSTGSTGPLSRSKIYSTQSSTNGILNEGNLITDLQDVSKGTHTLFRERDWDCHLHGKDSLDVAVARDIISLQRTFCLWRAPFASPLPTVPYIPSP